MSVFNSIGSINPKSKYLEWLEKYKNKPRISVKLILSDGSKINLAIVNINYISAHYTPTDLCMLTDFKEIKEKLSIVAKSFVTIGKPLKLQDTFVYIRDTNLVLPVVNKS